MHRAAIQANAWYVFSKFYQMLRSVTHFSGTVQRPKEERFGWQWGGAAVKDFLNVLWNPWSNLCISDWTVFVLCKRKMDVW